MNCAAKFSFIIGLTLNAVQAQNLKIIIGGENTTITEYPYIVSLYGRRKFKCGGSILTANWILTAAHCLKLYYYEYGQTERDIAGRDHMGRIIRSIGHPQYNREKHINDIAVIKVDLEHCVDTSFEFTYEPILGGNYNNVGSKC